MNLSLESILALTGGKPLGSLPVDRTIAGVATLKDATPDEAAFLGNEKYFQDFLHTRAGIVLVPPNLPHYPDGVAMIEVPNPSLAFNALVKHFVAAAYQFKPGIHPTAVIDPSVQLDPATVRVGAHVTIGAGCVIGSHCDIGSHCNIGDSVTMGSHCRLHPNVTVRERCKLGNHVVVQPGAVIGSDGFGFLMGENGYYVGIEQAGIVEIGDHVDIGANTTIDRARFGRTVIGEGTKIDNLVQIGHNVVIGKHCIIVAQSGIAGSTVVDDYVTIAAQVGIAGHLHIGNQVMIGAKAGVQADIPAGTKAWGLPATTFTEASKQYVALRKLPALLKEVRDIKKRLDSSEQN